MEQFWPDVKNKVNRGTFFDDEDLKTRSVDGCKNAPVRHVKAFIQNSCNQFKKCRNKPFILSNTVRQYLVSSWCPPESLNSTSCLLKTHVCNMSKVASHIWHLCVTR